MKEGYNVAVKHKYHVFFNYLFVIEIKKEKKNLEREREKKGGVWASQIDIERSIKGEVMRSLRVRE